MVAAGSSSRFNGDKMMASVGGTPLVAVTVGRVLSSVDRCVVVTRPELFETLAGWCEGVIFVPGGETRTDSEVAGIDALDTDYDLVGVHDGARPNPSEQLIESLFEAAGEFGGAVPVLDTGRTLLDRDTLRPMRGVVTVQTPQVFRGTELLDAYRSATSEGFIGHDTADVVQRYTDLKIVAATGEQSNIKVTYQRDLDRVNPP